MQVLKKGKLHKLPSIKKSNIAEMKGQKTGGRTVGTENKVTKELRTVLKNVIHKELEDIPGHLAKLDAKDRLEVIIKLLPFALPKVDGVHYAEGEGAWSDFP